MPKLPREALTLGAKAVRFARSGLSTAAPSLELVPQVGLGPVLLHASLDEVLDALADLPGAIAGHRVVTYADQLGAIMDDPPDGALATFFRGALRVDLDGEERVRHVSAAPSTSYEITLGGLDVFDVEATELFEVVQRLEPDPDAVPYAHADVVFPHSGITLHDASSAHDTHGEGARPIWGRVGVGRPTEG